MMEQTIHELALQLGIFISQINQSIYITKNFEYTPIDYNADNIKQQKYDNDQIINNVEQYNDQLIYFIGINNLRSRRVGEEYLMLDGLDETELSDEEYFKLCNAEVDSKTKINKIEEFLKQISTTANKIILYRTDAEPFDINVPDNCIVVPQSVTEMLKDDIPYRRSYYDKQTYKKITKTLLQYFINE